MRLGRSIKKLLGGPILLTIWIAGFGQAVLQLWNWLVPQIFGLRPITFWQAVGLMGLSWLLFGGLRGLVPHRMGHKHRMSPEQRERFRNAFRREWHGDQQA